MRISRTIEIMFEHKPSRSISVCKVDASRLNWKLRKLQNEGMYIIGVLLQKESNLSIFEEELRIAKGDPIDRYKRYEMPVDLPPTKPNYPPGTILMEDHSDRCTDEAVQKEENGC